MKSKLYLPALAVLAMLGGCQKGAETEKGAAKAAGGEVLPGSVSDAMIDLDGATGMPPLQPAPKAKASGDAPQAQASGNNSDAPAADPATAPAAAPAPTPAGQAPSP